MILKDIKLSKKCELHVLQYTGIIIISLIPVKCTCELVIIVYNVKEVSWTGSYGRWMYSIQHNVIKFVSDLRQVGSFLRELRFPPPIKLTATV